MTTKLLFNAEHEPAGNVASVYAYSEIPKNLIMASLSTGPSVLITQRFKYSSDLGILAVELSDIISVVSGKDDYWLVVEDNHLKRIEPAHSTSFTDYCRLLSPRISALAEAVAEGLLGIDPSLDLTQNRAGRWVNLGVNFVTLKAQPRKDNIQFTLYGNPSDFEHDGFLKRDQNSYCRGWIKDTSDVQTFLQLAERSYEKRVK